MKTPKELHKLLQDASWIVRQNNLVYHERKFMLVNLSNMVELLILNAQIWYDMLQRVTRELQGSYSEPIIMISDNLEILDNLFTIKFFTMLTILHIARECVVPTISYYSWDKWVNSRMIPPNIMLCTLDE